MSTSLVVRNESHEEGEYYDNLEELRKKQEEGVLDSALIERRLIQGEVSSGSYRTESYRLEGSTLDLSQFSNNSGRNSVERAKGVKLSVVSIFVLFS